MAKFIERNPVTGVETWADSTIGDHRQQFHYRQDVEPILDLAKYERDNGLADTKKAKQDDIRLYARIPETVILELRFKWGCDIFDRNHLKRAMYLINTEYPHCKTTNMTHTLAQ